MVFSSPTFLFAFLPVVLFTVYCARKSVGTQNALLLAFSLFFYASADDASLSLIVASIAFNYAGGLLVTPGRRGARFWLFLTVFVNLAILAKNKYAALFVRSINDLWGDALLAVPQVALPVGISFFTFHAISYVVDIARGHKRAQKNPLLVGLTILLFPQLIAGPIVRYGDIAEQLLSRRLSLAGFALGVRRFIVGLAKKVLIADNLAGLVEHGFGNVGDAPGALLAWAAAIAYMGQIYFDFSGYSDMAIGLAHMIGFHFKENFDHPYESRSITEFWRRWHISLSTWFRDYLYIPLGGNRCPPWRRALNAWLVFLLCGLWHGAEITFVVWGAYHGLLLAVERGRFGRLLARLPRPLSHAYTLFVVLIGWVVFRADSLIHATRYISAMLSLPYDLATRPYDSWAELSASIDLLSALVLVAATLLSTRLLYFRVGALFAPEAPARALTLSRDLVLIGCLVVAVTSASATTFRPFLYFRF